MSIGVRVAVSSGVPVAIRRATDGWVRPLRSPPWTERIALMGLKARHLGARLRLGG
jgi:hypothetical protein